MPSKTDGIKIFVTGGSGVLGRNVIARLLESDFKVKALKHNHSLLHETADGFESVKGDVLDFDGSWLKDIDVVLHLAAQTRMSQYADMRRINVEGTKQVVRAVERSGRSIRVVFSSSIAVFGPCSGNVPLTDESRLEPITEYGRTKLEAERLVMEHSDSVAIRFPMIVGGGDRASRIFGKLAAARLFPVAEKSFSAIDMRDAVRLILHAALDPSCSGRIFTVSDGNAYSWRDVARIFEKRDKRSFFKPAIPDMFLHPVFFKIAGNADGAFYLKYNWVCTPDFPAGFSTEYGAFERFLS